MKTTPRSLLTLTLAIGSLLTCQAQDLQGKKVYYINSYHVGYAWSDGIQAGIQTVLKPTGAEVKIATLDTYRQKSPEHLAQAAAECQATIEQWKPDVVIVG